MLNLLIERRSGDKLEIVIPVYNESARIALVIEYYKTCFDIVLLDGGSTDDTIQIGERLGATVFAREGRSIFTEQYFSHYLNKMSASGRCFYMFADEHVEKGKLAVMEALIKKGEVIMGNRIDWCYGQKVAWFTSQLPRGGSKHDIVYNPADLHNGLKFKASVVVNFIDIQHLQIWDMQRFLGQCAQYAALEIEKFHKSKYPVWKFIKRFILFEFLTLPRRLWRQRRSSIAFQCWQVLIAFVVPIVALLCLIEARYFLSPAKQREFYSKFYDET